jgi:alkyl sulfatase BDS1-like metallo-beta-lactamase superfamily hydrolase
MGGAEAVLERARLDFDAGDYRWVSEVVGHVVFSDPDNVTARHLQAAAFEQLGYQAESAPWRNVYLSGAFELREGIRTLEGARSAYPVDVVAAMTVENIFDSFGVRLDGPAAEALTLCIGWRFVDAEEEWTLWVENAAVHYRRGLDESATARVELSRPALDRLASDQSTIEDELTGPEFSIIGDAQTVRHFIALLEKVDRYFPIVTP